MISISTIFFELSEDAEPMAGELDATVLPPLGIRQ